MVFGLSTKSLEPLGVAAVRSYVTLFLGNRSLVFSDTLQLVSACKCEKIVPRDFLKKIPDLPILAKNSPKLAILAQNAQKRRFFAFFFAICSLEFANFWYEV